MGKLVIVELLALIKQYNKKNIRKIQNVHKMKRNELLEICQAHGLISGDFEEHTYAVCLKNASKQGLMEDVELHYLKKGIKMPPDVSKMRKKDLIEFMENENIRHYTQDLLKKEFNEYEENERMKNIIYYNILKYDNIDVNEIDDIRSFIENKNLDTNLMHFQKYSIFIKSLYDAYDNFCIATGLNLQEDRMKSFPKILYHLTNLKNDL